MKKLLVFGVMFGILFGIMGVMAVSQQPIEVIIGEDISLVITPGTLNFGSVTPLIPGTNGNPADNGPIGFDADGSNVDVTVAVTSVTGFPFVGGLMLDGLDPVGQSFLLVCTDVGGICTYTPASTVPTLDVPLGAAQGDKDGAITYLITGSPPA